MNMPTSKERRVKPKASTEKANTSHPGELLLQHTVFSMSCCRQSMVIPPKC